MWWFIGFFDVSFFFIIILELKLSVVVLCMEWSLSEGSVSWCVARYRKGPLFTQRQSTLAQTRFFHWRKTAGLRTHC